MESMRLESMMENRNLESTERKLMIWKTHDPKLINCKEIYKKGDAKKHWTDEDILNANRNFMIIYVKVFVKGGGRGGPEVCTPIAQLCEPLLKCQNWVACQNEFNKYFTNDMKKNQRIEGMKVTYKMKNVEHEVNLNVGLLRHEDDIRDICLTSGKKHEHIIKVELEIETDPNGAEVNGREIVTEMTSVDLDDVYIGINSMRREDEDEKANIKDETKNNAKDHQEL